LSLASLGCHSSAAAAWRIDELSMSAARTPFVLLVVALAIVAVLVAAAAAGQGPEPLVRAWEEVEAWAMSSSLWPDSVEALDGGREGGAPVPTRRQRSPLSPAQLDAPLVHGKFVAACGAPDDMKVTLEVTVHAGRAFAAVAKTQPPNPVVEACVERAVRELRWDSSPTTGKVTVHY
jgi:hypothetical protein